MLIAGKPIQSQKRGLIPEDYYNFTFVSDLQISPDGQKIAFVVSKVSKNKRSRESSIWLVPSNRSKKPIQFTRAPGTDPPDGH